MTFVVFQWHWVYPIWVFFFWVSCSSSGGTSRMSWCARFPLRSLLPRALRKFNQHKTRKRLVGVFRKQEFVTTDKIVWGLGRRGQSGLKKLVSCVKEGARSPFRTWMKGKHNPEEFKPQRAMGPAWLVRKIGVKKRSRRYRGCSGLDDEGLDILEKYWGGRITELVTNHVRSEREVENLCEVSNLSVWGEGVPFKILTKSRLREKGGRCWI